MGAIPQKPGEKSRHYQITASNEKGTVGTFVNRYPQGIVDMRTDIYFLETHDLGQTRKDVEGKVIDIPLLNEILHLKSWIIPMRKIFF